MTIRLTLEWKHHGVEYIARSLFNAEGERYVCEWRAFKNGPREWVLGLSAGRSGKHVPLTTATTLQEIKNRALCVAAELYHETCPEWTFLPPNSADVW